MITIEGARTFVYNKGTGETNLVFVHGATYNHRLWRRQASAMSKISQVLVPDLPGHGASTKLTGGQAISVQAYANHIETILAAMKCRSIVLIGHSMGGAISMRYALDHPEGLRALVLIGTGAKLGVSPAILKGLANNYVQAIRSSIVGLAYAKGSDRRIVNEGIKEMLKCEQGIALADFNACNEFDVRETVSNIQAPTLIIVGEEDKLTPVRWSEFLHNKIRNSDLKIIASAGHMAMLEKPNEVNDALIAFIRKVI